MLFERFLTLPSARIASDLSGDTVPERLTPKPSSRYAWVLSPRLLLNDLPRFSSRPSQAMLFNPHSTPNPRQQRVIHADHGPLSRGPASSRRALCSILATAHFLPTSPPRQSLDPAPPINQVINHAINMLSAREASLPKQKIDTRAWPRCAAILPSKPSRPAQSGLCIDHAYRLRKRTYGDDDCCCDRGVLDCD
ncbi:hypothetical protein BC567DRAFT_20682 [Phyllosticta citribraziliensis]